ncbi:hypothetical protein K2Z84_26110 [Candidatus Binatia bacterium]|nr:hypothetical protein [Candidatus Binatia bacterium]
MKLDVRTTALAAALLLTAGSAAHALVLAEKSPAQKLRADIGKQMTGYVKCLGRAYVACEKTGTQTGTECTLATGTAAPSADPKGKFANAVAKCDAKLDFTKKAPRDLTSLESYRLLGCPRFTLPFQLSGLEQLQQAFLLLKPALDDIIPTNMPAASGCNDGKSCAVAAQAVLDFLDALNRCELSCEEDYANKRGDGGTTDNLTRCDATGDPNAQACITRATDRFRAKASFWPQRDAVIATFTPLLDPFFDSFWNIPDQCL